MAVCKQCGCAIPLGSKTCDMCATVGAIAPSQPVWTPPKEVAGAAELSRSAASWATTPGTIRQTDLEKAKKGVRRGFRIYAIIGIINVGLGLLAELADLAPLQSIFNWYSAVEGGIFLLIAYFVRRGSLAATIVGAVLYLLDTLALILAGSFSIVRLVILVFLGEAILAANQLRKQRKLLAQQPRADQAQAA
ncbi:MAG TPA: hypothetical protein VF990_13565 [Candidatus Dormibacteraeota bacterium]